MHSCWARGVSWSQRQMTPWLSSDLCSAKTKGTKQSGCFLSQEIDSRKANVWSRHGSHSSWRQRNARSASWERKVHVKDSSLSPLHAATCCCCLRAVCVSFGSQGIALDAILRKLFLWDRVSQWSGNIMFRVGWLVGKSQGLSCLCLPRTEIADVNHHGQQFYVDSGGVFVLKRLAL